MSKIKPTPATKVADAVLIESLLIISIVGYNTFRSIFTQFMLRGFENKIG